MRQFNVNYLINAAITHSVVMAKDAIAAAVCSACEVGMAVPSILRKALLDAGYTILHDDKEMAKEGYRELKNCYRCIIKDAGGITIAHATSHSEADALLHAVLGYVVELDSDMFGARLPNEFHDDFKLQGGTNAKPNWPTTDGHRANFDKLIKHLQNKNKK